MRYIYVTIFPFLCLVAVSCSYNSADSSPARKPQTASLKHGKILYQFYCAGCHGDNGRGDGSELLGENVHVPNIVSENKELNTDEEDSTICTSHWSRIQAPNAFNKQELYDVSLYVRSLEKTPSKSLELIGNQETIRARY